MRARFWHNVQRDIDDELRFHFDARIEELVQQGCTREAARARALEEFGNVDDVRTGLRTIGTRVARRRRRLEVIESTIQDVAYAVRSLRRAPSVSLTIVLTLALGLGMNAAMFSLLDVIFLRAPAGVVHPEQVRRLWSSIHTSDGTDYWPGFAYAAYAELQRARIGASDMAIYQYPDRPMLGRGEDGPHVNTSGASASYFRLLGLKPLVGRFYGEDEDQLDGAASVAVVSEAFWRRELGGDARGIGQQIVLGGKPVTVIGVTPPKFSGVDLEAVDVWLPLATNLARRPKQRVSWYRNPNINGFQILLRLAPDARVPELEQRSSLVLRQPGVGFRQDTTAVASLGALVKARGPGKIQAEVQVAMRLAAVAVIVLLIACANVVNLLLARAVRRRREIAVRLALGISQSRLVRMLVTESVLLAVIAGVGALAAASWGGVLLRKLLMPDVVWSQPPLHWRVLLFALGVALAVGALVGLVPAAQSRAPDLTSALKAGSREGGARRSRLREFLVVCQAALSVVLLIGAALFVKSLNNIRGLDIGFTVNRLAFVNVQPPGAEFRGDAATADRLLQLETRIASIPGIERVAYTSMRPKYGIHWEDFFPDADTIAHKKPTGFATAVSPSFFAATGARLIRGRGFTEGAAARSELAVIINQAMADALWPSQDPLGKCIRFEKPDAPCATIIGIAQNALLINVKETPPPQMYVSLANIPYKGWSAGDIVLRILPDRMTPALTNVSALLRAEFPKAKVTITTMEDAMAADYRPWRLGATLFTLFGALAALVAAIGIYSTVSYAVSQRVHEFGVRAALGANARSIVQHVLGEGVRTVFIGVIAGVLLAAALGRFVAALLYGVTPQNPVAMAVASFSLLAVAVVASLAPAWRAARADPVAALRAD